MPYPDLHSSTPRIAPAVAVGLGCMLLVASWQTLTVHANYRGQWTALFCIGSAKPLPPALAAAHPFVFASSTGYDGQYFYEIAHDPWLQRGFAQYVDEPAFRYRRILLPALAWLLAGAEDARINAAYIAVFLFSVGLGGYWLSRLSSRSGLPALWGFAFLLIPATLVSVDRLTVDGSLAALCVGIAWFVISGQPLALWLAFAAAALCRETGLILLAGYCLYLLLNKRFRHLGFFVLAAVPALLWWWYVRLHAGPFSLTLLGPVPFAGLMVRLLHPASYPFSSMAVLLIRTLDVIAMLGIVLDILSVVKLALDRQVTPLTLPLFLFTALTIFIVHREVWWDAYSFGRVLSPLLVFNAIQQGILERRWLALLPLCMIDLRVALQLGPQILGVL